MLKKLFSHTAIYGLAPQITLVVNFFTLPIITKDLTATDFGVSGTLTAYTTAISVLAVLGLRVVLVNSFYKSPEQYKWAWRQIYGFLTLWNIIYAAILGVLVYLAVPDVAQTHKWTIVFLNVAPLVFFGQTATIGRTFYQLKQKPFQIAIRSLIFGIMTIGLNIIFISVYKMGYMGWFWSAFIVGILTNVSYWYPINKKLKLSPIFNFKRRFIQRSLKVSLPTVPHFYSGYLLNSSDRLVMDQLGVSTTDLGKYSAANTFGTLMDGFSTATGWAIGPLVNERFKVKDDLGARNLIFLLQVVFWGLTFVACIWLKEIFHLMISNAELSKTYPLGIVMIMSFNYRPMYFGSVNKLFFYEKTNLLWQITLIAGVFNVVLNLILVPILGYEVAAYTTFVAFMYMGFAGFFYKTFKQINTVNYHPILWLIGNVILLGAAYLVVELGIIYKVIISLVALAISVQYIRKLNKTL
jgi:O-antigen/teichoic acid export membrane protein